MVSGGAQASGLDPRRVGWEQREWVLSQYIHVDERHDPFGFIFYLTFYEHLHAYSRSSLHVPRKCTLQIYNKVIYALYLNFL
jgi:hypothetical protein